MTVAHNTSNSTYRSWRAMLTRCYNPNRRGDWIRYGGRGIRVCSRWRGKEGFLPFVADMGERPLGTTLDRIDSDGDYTPGNCCWSTPAEQIRNRRKGFFRGEKNNQAVLTPEQVQEIGTVWDALPLGSGGKKLRGTACSTIQELASKFKVSFGCIHKLVYGQTWREE